jgi:acetyltransferase-like isoleucine patch superfamily enzyme
MTSKASKFLKKSLPDKINTLHHLLLRLKARLYYQHVFGSLGHKSVLYKPLLLSNPQLINIGNNVLIRQGIRLDVIRHNPQRVPSLSIGNNVNIEQNVHIVCQSRIRIGNNVSITGNCAIVDTTHPYQDVADPCKIGARILDEPSFVEIDDGSFIGYGTIILPNVRIGKHCVIGANSCVTRDVPDYCVAWGNPATVKSRYDFGSDKWIKADAT